MFLLVSRYTAPPERIEELVPEHRAYLERMLAGGRFVVTGRRVPWTGGAIVARGTRAEVEAWVAEDPFARAGAAETEIVEFEPRFWADGFDAFL
ncbi:MAG TPA: YciI family protein [Gaiellaceae bacterium]|nr:YciI family protein [Gaiellaceae bacterium]